MSEIVSDNERAIALSSIKLSEDSVKGLMPLQIEAMKQTTLDVNDALNVAGTSIRSAAYALFTLKKNLKHGNWTAYLKSGVLNVSEKAASDLVSAYSNWLSTDTSVSDYILATMTPRTLAAVANAPQDVRNKVLSKVMGGSKTSEAEVRKIIKGNVVKKPADASAFASAGDDMEAAVHTMTEVVKNTKKASIDELVALTEKCEALENENKLLKARVKELEAELAKV